MNLSALDALVSAVADLEASWDDSPLEPAHRDVLVAAHVTLGDLVRGRRPAPVPEADDDPSSPVDGALTVYTDGACSHGGVGGWAWWVSPAAFASGSEHFTTNNAMELWAVIAALEAIAPDVELTIVSDSAYVVNAFAEDWIGAWRANGWRNSKKEPVSNRELWEELLAQVAAHRGGLRWVHTRGHGKGAAEHKHGNNQADKLALAARLDFVGEHDARGEPSHTVGDWVGR